MIEITFTESAGGGLKMAHALLHNQQSSSQTTLPTEIPPSFQAYVGENVFCFSLMLTVGKISDPVPLENCIVLLPQTDAGIKYRDKTYVRLPFASVCYKAKQCRQEYFSCRHSSHN